jgi:hypothetical protein
VAGHHLGFEPPSSLRTTLALCQGSGAKVISTGRSAGFQMFSAPTTIRTFDRSTWSKFHLRSKRTWHGAHRHARNRKRVAGINNSCPGSVHEFRALSDADIQLMLEQRWVPVVGIHLAAPPPAPEAYSRSTALRLVGGRR